MTAATLEPTPEVLARRRGRCRLCRDFILRGEHWVTKVGSLGWVHGRCAAGYRHALAENLEKGEEG